MFIDKQDKFSAAPVARRRQAFRKSVWTGLGLALCCAFAPAARAQDTDNAGRTGDTPNPTVKKDSVPQGVKTGGKAAKSATKPAKTTTPAKSAKAMTGPRQIALVFPVDAKGAAAEQISDVITDVEKARLSASGRYGAISFLTSLPSIRRAVGEQSLTNADVAPPFASRTKAQKLTTTAGYDLAVINSLDQYEYNPDTQNVTMVLSIQMIDFSGSVPRSYTAAEPVTTAPKSAKNATDTTASEAAARNLTEKLMTNVLNSAMGAKTPTTAPAAGTPRPAAK